MAEKKVIVDVDAGSDDAMALMVLLAAAERRDVHLMAITCVHGNTTVDNVCTNVLRVLQAADRLDIPVFKGAATPLIVHDPCLDGERYHGEDGFGDVQFSVEPDMSLIQEESAVSALHRMTSGPEHKGKVTLVCLGPLTNLALALKTYPDLTTNIKDLYIMGGNSTGKGNVTPTAEHNFYVDPEAAHIVLESIQSPIVLLPWETCLDVPLPLEWRFGQLGENKRKLVQLLNSVDRSIYERLNCKSDTKSEVDGKTYYTCDPLVVAVLLQPDIVTKSRDVHLSVELHGHRTRGQVVLDHLNTNSPNVKIIDGIHIELFKEMLLRAAAGL